MRWLAQKAEEAAFTDLSRERERKREREREAMAASKELFKGLEQALSKEGEKLVKLFKGVALFKIDGQDFLLDLKNGSGKLYFDGSTGSGAPKADVTLTMSDDVFVKLASGKLQPQMAFIQGKLKIQGNIALSMKLTPVLKAAQPKASL